MTKIKISKVKENQLFNFDGKIYKFVNNNKNWKLVCDENGNEIKNPPIELLISSTIVELKENRND